MEWLDIVTAGLVVPLRWLVLVLALPVMVWAFPGALWLARRPSVVNGFRALAFWVAFASASFQSSYVLEGLPMPSPHPRTVFSLVLLITCLVLAIGGLWIFRKLRAGGHVDLIDAIEATGPVAQLYRVDPDSARELAVEARRRLARRVLEE